MDAQYIESRVKGSIVGLLVGDALGFPFSDVKTPTNQINDESASGLYEGPGALTLCTIASINEFHGIDNDDIIEKFNDFVIGGYLGSHDECSDVSGLTIQAVKNFTNGMPADRCAPDSSMTDGEFIPRLLPVALWFSQDEIPILIDSAHSTCKITHLGVKEQVVAAAYCLAVRNLFIQKSEKIFDILGEYYKTQKLESHEKALDKLRYWVDNNSITGGHDPMDSFWSAWKSFAAFDSDFEDCVKMAVGLGNDANTTGAIAGSLSALSNGLDSIPMKWLRTLKLSGEVMGTINDFVGELTARNR